MKSVEDLLVCHCQFLQVNRRPLAAKKIKNYECNFTNTGILFGWSVFFDSADIISCVSLAFFSHAAMSHRV